MSISEVSWKGVESISLSEVDSKEAAAVNSRITSKKSTGIQYISDPNDDLSKIDSRKISNKKTDRVTLFSALNNGFRYRNLLQVRYMDNRKPVDLEAGYFGSNRSLCQTIIPNVLPLQLYISKDYENPEILSYIDAAIYKDWETKSGKGMFSHRMNDGEISDLNAMCKSFLAIRRNTTRHRIEAKKNDFFLLAKFVEINIVDIEVHKEKGYVPKLKINQGPLTIAEKKFSSFKANDLTSSPVSSDKVKSYSKPKRSVKFSKEAETLVFNEETKSNEIELVYDPDEGLNSFSETNIAVVYPEIKSLKISIKDIKTMSCAKFDFGSKSKLLIGSAPDCDICINKEGISKYHASIDYRNGVLYFYDLTELPEMTQFYITRPIEANPFDVLYLNGKSIRLKENDLCGWSNAACIVSKVRSSSRKEIVSPDSDFYPKLIMSLGLKMFSTQYVIGSSKTSLISVKDLSMAPSHCILSLDSFAGIFSIEPVCTAITRSVKILVGRAPYAGEVVNFNRKREIGRKLTKKMKFKIGTSVFVVKSISKEALEDVHLRSEQLKTVLPAFRSIKEFKLLSTKEISSLVNHSVEIFLGDKEVLTGSLEDSYFIVITGEIELESDKKKISAGGYFGKGPSVFATRNYDEKVLEKKKIGSSIGYSTIYVISNRNLFAALGPLEGCKGNLEHVFLKVPKKTKGGKKDVLQIRSSSALSEEEAANIALMTAEEDKAEESGNSGPYVIKKNVIKSPKSKDSKTKTASPFSPKSTTPREEDRKPVTTTEQKSPKLDVKELSPSASSPKGTKKSFWSSDEEEVSESARRKSSIRKKSFIERMALEKQLIKANNNDEGAEDIEEIVLDDVKEPNSSKSVRKSWLDKIRKDPLLVNEETKGNTSKEAPVSILNPSKPTTPLNESVPNLQSKYLEECSLNPFYIVLEAVAGPSRRTIFYCSESIITFGRIGGDASIKLQDRTLDLINSKIEYYEGNFYLKDCDSKNGTFVLATPEEQEEIFYGDIFQCGETQFQILGLPKEKSKMSCSIM